MQLFKKLGAVAAALLIATATVLPMASVDVSATADNITVPEATYHTDGSLASLTVEFDWNDSDINARLVLSDQKLTGSNAYDGVFTNFGSVYDQELENFNEVLQYNNDNGNCFGIVSYTDEKNIAYGSDDNQMTIEFTPSQIPSTIDKTYYVYQWTNNGTYYYPDNLAAAIQVLNGVIKYAAPNGINSVPDNAFVDIGTDPSNPTNPPAVDEDKTDDSTTIEQPSTEKPAEPAKDKQPETGDDSNAAAWMVLLMLSGAALAGTAVSRKMFN